MKCFGYVRVSTKLQSKEDKDGYTRQTHKIEEYCQNNNIELEFRVSLAPVVL